MNLPSRLLCSQVEQSPSFGITEILHYSFQTSIASGKYLLYATSGAQNCVKLCTEGSPPCYVNFPWDRWSGTSRGKNEFPVGPPIAHCAFTLHSSSVLSGVLEEVRCLWSRPQGRSEQNSHIHAGRKNKTRTTRPPSASSIRLQTGCGRTEGVPRGRRLRVDFFVGIFLRLPLSPLSCPRPLCTRRNRQFGGPVKVRRSASYISSPLSRAAELTSALIIAAGLWRHSLRTPGGKPWARMHQWQEAFRRRCDERLLAVSDEPLAPASPSSKKTQTIWRVRPF